ncbi:LysM domain-containing protein [Heracleum sosnowskyi]|uniref:LysM domain-containing protein n=1 Tax=Heracleum sosnowskyi TaxID=360622 RepID=A0AAD8HLT2_9APIA|nr:LysM domain-containing protein [Heracleum sosnowskyi]
MLLVAVVANFSLQSEMVKLNNTRAALLVLVLSLFLIITISESRQVSIAAKAKAIVTCDTVFGVRKGDTCFDIAQNFQLSTPEFDSINPNVNCTALFVGQWICIDGTA